MSCIFISVKKKRLLGPVAVDRHSKKIVHGVLGDRSEQTGKSLWNKMKYKAIKNAMTDY